MIARYLNMLAHYAFPELQRQNALSQVEWIKVGAPPHVRSSVNHLLNQTNSLETESSPVISRFRGHQGLLISQQWIYGCGVNPKCISLYLFVLFVSQAVSDLKVVIRIAI